MTDVGSAIPKSALMWLKTKSALAMPSTVTPSLSRTRSSGYGAAEPMNTSARAPDSSTASTPSTDWLSVRLVTAGPRKAERKAAPPVRSGRFGSETAFHWALMVLDGVTRRVQTALPDHGAETTQGDHPRARVSGASSKHPRPTSSCRGRTAHAPGPRPDGTRLSALDRPDRHLPGG